MKTETPYRHGGTPSLDFVRLNLPERKVIDYSVNLNPLGPPEIIREHWMEMHEGIQDYPTVEGKGAIRFFCEKLDIGPENCLAGNGSTELIYLVPRALGLRRVLVVTPSYNDYSRASALAGSAVTEYLLLPGASFDQEEIRKRLEDADALWLGSPNNPTGTLVPREGLLEMADEYPEKWIIVDEAFMPFVEERDQYSLARPPLRPNILVLYSVTKFYALAGLRLGGIIGHADAISRLKRIKEPWTVNGIAERVYPLLLECREYEGKTRALIRQERERLIHAFGSMRGIRAHASSVNFILCQWNLTDNLDDLMGFLLARGIYIRDCRNFPGLEKNYFRMAVRLSEENHFLIETLSSFPGNRA
jgi:threonine-phosphate decarboxylase